MSESQRRQDRPGLQGAIAAMRERDDGMELAVRLSNPLDRAIHYISDVRAMVFDRATNRLRVRLTDQGRAAPMVGISMQPRFRQLDPRADAELTLQLPRTIVRLADAPTPTGEVAFEEFVVADAATVEVEIGWADTPYYSDPRIAERGVDPVAAWEQEQLTMTLDRRAETA